MVNSQDVKYYDAAHEFHLGIFVYCSMGSPGGNSFDTLGVVMTSFGNALTREEGSPHPIITAISVASVR